MYRFASLVFAFALLVAAGIAGYLVYSKSRRSPQEKARVEIAEAETVLARATRSVGAVRPGSNVAQARDFLRDAKDSFQATRYEEAFRLAVESQSYSRRALGGSGQSEQGDASFIFVEGDVSLQRAGRSTFEPARQRQPLFDGDFVKAGKTGSAEIMFYDGTLFPWKGDLFAGGLSSQAIIRLTLDGATVKNEERLNMGRRMRDVLQAPDGAIIAVTDDKQGELLRLTPARAKTR